MEECPTKMKLRLFLIFLLFLMPITLADKVILNDIYETNSDITIDGISYNLHINEESNAIVLRNIFFVTVIKINDCTYENNMKYCFTELIKKDVDRYAKVRIQVIKYDDQTFIRDNKTITKLGIGYKCDYDQQCLSNICLNNLCSIKSPACGDGYCNDKETCKEDCLISPKIISTNPYTINFSANVDWVDTNFILNSNKKYYLNVTNGAYLTSSNKKITGYSKYSPCGNFSYDSVVARLCDKCYQINELTTISLNQSCKLFVRINDDVLYDNHGEINIQILEGISSLNSKSNKIITPDEAELEKELTSIIKNYFALKTQNKFLEASRLGVGIFQEYNLARNEGYLNVVDTIQEYDPNFDISKIPPLRGNSSVTKTSIELTSNETILHTTLFDGTSTYIFEYYFIKLNEGYKISDISQDGRFTDFKDIEAEREYFKTFNDNLIKDFESKSEKTNPTSEIEKTENGISWYWTINFFCILWIAFEMVFRNKNISLGNKWLIFLGSLISGVLTAIIFFFVVKYKNYKIQNEISNLEQESEDLLQIKKKKEQILSEKDKSIEQKNKIEKEINKINQDYIKLQQIKREKESLIGDYDKHNKEKAKLNEDISKLDSEIASLSENKLKRETILKHKKKEYASLEAKFKKELAKVKEKYIDDPDKLKAEEQFLEEDFEEEKKNLEKAIDTAEKSLNKTEDKISKKEEKQQALAKTSASKVINTDFKKSYASKFSKCEALSDYVDKYISLFHKDSSKLTDLSKLFQEKTNSDNYAFIYSTIKKLYDNKVSSLLPNIITDLTEIDDMSGLDFEVYLEKMYEQLGYNVTKTKASRDGGVDLILKKESSIILVQAKRYKITGTVGVDAVRDVYSKKKTLKASELIVLTTAMKYSLDAKKEAKDLGVKLLNRDDFKKLLRKSKMIKNG